MSQSGAGAGADAGAGEWGDALLFACGCFDKTADTSRTRVCLCERGCVGERQELAHNLTASWKKSKVNPEDKCLSEPQTRFVRGCCVCVGWLGCNL